MSTKSEKEAKIKQLKKELDEMPEYTLSNKILEKYDLITILGVVMTKSGNSYVPYEVQLRKFILEDLKEHNVSSTIKNRVINNIKDITATEDEEFFTHEDWIVPFTNGFYNVKTEEFKSLWGGDKKFFYEIPHPYNEDFKGCCSNFKEALKDYLKFQRNVNLCTLEDIFEIMGYCMAMNTNLKKAFYIFGPTNTGKTTFQTIFLHIIGDKNLANISLWRMQKNEFGTDGLQLKILNTVAETHGGRLNDISYFKQLTGADIFISVEPKGEKKGRFINSAKLLYLGNMLPLVAIQHWNDHAFYKRWILINFAQTFKVTREKFSDYILSNPDEVQGIIHECIEGLKRLFKRGDFRPELIEDSEHIWKYNSDSLYRFIHDKCEFDSIESVKQNEFAVSYVKYVVKNDLGIPIANQKITTDLRKYGILQTSCYDGGKRIYEYDGIKFKTDEAIKQKKETIEKIVEKAIGTIDKSYKDAFTEWEDEETFLAQKELHEEEQEKYNVPPDLPEPPEDNDY